MQEMSPELKEVIRRIEAYERAWDCLDEAKIVLLMVDPPEDTQVQWTRTLTRIATSKNELAKMGARREPNATQGPQVPMGGLEDGSVSAAHAPDDPPTASS